ncbi:hypothetical protein KKF82_05870 [Patescibacteria group bacterium]|nr:hypothetical protein [Patescibacteria group bacterium]
MLDDLRKFAKDIGREDLLDNLNKPTRREKEKSSTAELKYHKKRKKNRIVKTSRKKNR